MAINTLPNGYILNGDYRIIRVLGQGGFGVTYLSEDVNLGHKVVIKEFMPQSMSVRDQSQYTIHPYTDGETMFSHMLNRFLEEAKLLATLRHPSIVKVTRFLKANNTAYFVMDYEEGITFEDYLKQHSILDEEKLLSIMMPILEGAKYIHLKGVLHRDIAPDNIFLRKNGMPMLIDFGAARNEVAQKSQSLSAIVKEGYSPPEQFTAENQSPATDIYALGAVMYRAITGKKTPNAMSRAMSKNSDNTIENELNKHRGKYNDNLLNAIKKSLNIQVEDRFQSVGDFQKAISSGVIPTPTPNDEQTSPTPTPNNNGKIVLAIMVALFIGIGSYIYMGNNNQDTTQSTYTVSSTETNNPDNEAERKAQQAEIERLKEEKAEAERKAQQDEIERLKEEKAEADRKAQQAEIERLKEEKAEADRKAQQIARENKVPTQKNISFNENGIDIEVKYPSFIKKGDIFYITAKMTNYNKTAKQGGFTLSFPDMSSMRGKIISSNFTTVKGYSYPDKIYNKNTRGNMKTEYFMVEGWQSKRWHYGDSKYLKLAFQAPSNIEQLLVNVRGILWIRGSKDTRANPVNGFLKDQQGFLVKRFKIQVKD